MESSSSIRHSNWCYLALVPIPIIVYIRTFISWCVWYQAKIWVLRIQKWTGSNWSENTKYRWLHYKWPSYLINIHETTILTFWYRIRLDDTTHWDLSYLFTLNIDRSTFINWVLIPKCCWWYTRGDLNLVWIWWTNWRIRTINRPLLNI